MNPNPAKYGYDMSKVPRVLCLYCRNAIDNEPYREVRVLARFGQMLFAHRRCDTVGDETDHLVSSDAPSEAKET